MAAQLEDLIRHGIASVQAARGHFGRWVAIGVRRRQYRPSRGEVCVGRGKAAVFCERLLHQRVEPGVVVQPPPIIRRLRRGLGGRIQRHQRCLGARRQLGCMIVRAHSASGECGADGHTHHNESMRPIHGGFDPRVRNRGTADAGPSGAALRNTTISNATAVSKPTATKPSMTAWVLTAARTTFPNTSSPRETAEMGSMTRVVAAPYALTRWMT